MPLLHCPGTSGIVVPGLQVFRHHLRGSTGSAQHWSLLLLLALLMLLSIRIMSNSTPTIIPLVQVLRVLWEQYTCYDRPPTVFYFSSGTSGTLFFIHELSFCFTFYLAPGGDSRPVEQTSTVTLVFCCIYSREARSFGLNWYPDGGH